MNALEFIDWLTARMKIKHSEDYQVIKKVKSLKQILQMACYLHQSPDSSVIENICKNCWYDFEETKTNENDFLGYTLEEKEQMKTLMTKAINTYIDILHQKAINKINV